MPATPSKKTTDRLPKNKKSYGQGWGQSKKFDVTTPSGALCEVKRPGVNGLIKAGILDSMDSLTAIVAQDTIPNAEGRPKIDVQSVLEDPSKFNDMTDMLDKIVMYCVTQPKLEPIPYKMKPIVREIPLDNGGTIFEETGKEEFDLDDEGKRQEIPEDERDQDKFYIDQVEIEDKTFIMNFVMGGQADVADFRQKSADALAGVQSGEAAAQDA
jgi:hypothetical protein